jgi:hypothetical protein
MSFEKVTSSFFAGICWPAVGAGHISRAAATTHRQVKLMAHLA